MSNTHKCAADGCEVQVASKYLMCFPHWSRVPGHIQGEVWYGWRRREEGYSSKVWAAAVLRAKEAVANAR